MTIRLYQKVLALSVIDSFGVKVMVSKSFPRDLFPFSTGFTIITVRIDGDAAARKKFTPDLDIAGFHQLYQVIHDDVDTIFVEITMIAEAEQIEFQ